MIMDKYINALINFIEENDNWKELLKKEPYNLKTVKECSWHKGWYMFVYNGSVAFVSNKYVGENKVEVQQQVSADNGGGQASSNTTMECPYPMLQVIDEGGDKVYYYYTPSTQNRNIYDECASIIASRHGWYIDVVNGGTAGSGGAGEAEKTNYTYNGEVVYRARPCTYLIGPNGGGPKDALEVVICP